MIADTSSQDEHVASQPRCAWLKPVLIVIAASIPLYFGWNGMSNWYSGVPSVERETLNTAKVIRGNLQRDIAVSGKLVAANAPQLYSTESGNVDLLFKPGQHVELGQVVAVVDSPKLKALIRQQESTVTHLQTEAQRGNLADQEAQLDLQEELDQALLQLNAAKREKKRADLSFKQQVMSELDWQKEQDALKEAELDYQHAFKKVEVAKQRLSFEQQNRLNAVAREQLVLDELIRRERALEVKAPVSGIVGNWLVSQKERVASATALMSIVDLSNYEAELNVPEFYADDIGLGLQVVIQLSGQSLTGEVIAISPEINNNQVQVRAKVEGINQLKPRQNQRLNARIQFEKKEGVLMVERGAFTQSFGGNNAYVIDEVAMARKQPIQTGVSNVDFIEIISGLNEGEEIIVSSYENFFEYAQIQLTN